MRTDSLVAVVGAGLMGAGIADGPLARARAAIESSLTRLEAKGRLAPGTTTSALDRIVTTTDPDAVADAELVVEAVVEDVDLKRTVFERLGRICSPGAVLATNTSAIPITVIAAAARHPERVVGTHFFSPVPLMGLCELVRGRRTDDATLARARAFAESVGKTCIVVNRDVAGFVTTRLICALAMEAIRLVESGVATAEDVDTACRLGFGHAMGPLATADLTGLDVLRNATRAIHAETGNPTFVPPELLARMVDAGELGRKAGRGFYPYPE